MIIEKKVLFTYTQLTDIEQERNGLFYADRRPKFDAARLRAINSRRAAYEADPPVAPRTSRGPWKVLAGAAPDGDLAGPWRYVQETPPPEGWAGPDFDAAGWKEGRGGFGARGPAGTAWTGGDLWLCREFSHDGTPFGIALALRGGAAEVLVNGAIVWAGEARPDAYTGIEVTASLWKVLRAGRNTIAVRFHQDEGDRFADLALLVGP